LTIIYSGGVRGAAASPPNVAGGLARRATLVDRARLSARAIVQVDAGDLVGSVEDDSHLQDATVREARERLVLKSYQRMGVDAMTMGERDLALGVAALRSLADETAAPIVAANVIGDDGRPLFAADRIVQAGDVKVGVFGVLDLQGESWTAPAGVVLTDPVAAVRSAVRSLRAQGARVIVGLFHVAGGVVRAKAIAATTSGIDLVVLGHAGPAGSPQFVWPGVGGTQIGRVEVHISGHAVRLEDLLLATSPEVPEQLGVRLLVRVDSEPIAATFAESVAAMKAKGIHAYGEGWTYGSTALCQECHATQAAQWKTTDHAHAFETLQTKGNHRDPSCMGCHMTGFLLPGGGQNFESASQFADVGCEACHGPSVAHVVSRDKHRGTSRRVDPIVCLGCHTPDKNLGSFDVAKAMKEIVGAGHGERLAP
jgi:hypothetical protein